MTGVRGRLRNLSALLKSIPKHVRYAVIYILLIPLFAAFYSFVLPRDFYHSTAQYEYGPLSRAAARILDGIQKSIMEHLRAPSKVSSCDQWQIDRSYLRPYDLRVDGDDVTLYLFTA